MTTSALRRRIALITSADPDPTAGLGTGIVELDAALSRRGVPRGRLTEVTGTRGSGKATLLRHLVAATLARGFGAAYVDASRTLAPRDWAPAANAAGDRFWIVRSRLASRGVWCADVLLRSGAFALVVLDGAPPLPRAVAVRLTRLARDAAASFVVVGGDHAPPTMLSVEVEHAVSVAHRLCTHPEVPDRRGAARAGGGGGKGEGGQRAAEHAEREALNGREQPADEAASTGQPQPEHRRIAELAPVG